ncbi:MAG TPA: hypothetical protein PKC43_03490 [Phycisphaerales bacterium]|nr:hypothetical protein [Phycisphaerales bacterium]HMP36493.1 hypothetical protein [Phycisphaerales bacterium]
MHAKHLFAAAAALAATAAASAQALRINEIRVDQPGADVDEYIEIAGPPGTILNNIHYIVIGDAPGQIPPAQNGSIETVINLSGATIPPSGLLLVAKSTFSLGPTPDVIASFNLEEIDNTTHLLVQGFTGFLGQDLDTNNDGVLDITPWTAIFDDLALVINPNPNGITAEFFYSSTIVGPDGAFSPSHVWRCADTLQWQIGTFNFTGLDTPGAPNFECLSAPKIVINEIRIEQPGPEDDEYFELRGPAGAPLQGLTYIVIGDPTDSGTNTDSGVIEAVIPLDGFSLNANGFFLVAEDADTFGSVADLIATLNFEGADNVTHLLVSGFSGFDGQDLDLDDDGVLDIEPWDFVVDSVALLRSTQTPPPPGLEWWYSETTVGPEGPFVPGHVYRCVPDGNWLIGPFNPAEGVDTPGFTNSECTVCGVPGSGSCFDEQAGPGCDSTLCCNAVCGADPSCCEVAWDAGCVALAQTLCLVGGGAPPVLINEIRIDQPGVDDDEYFELVGPPGTSLDGVYYIVIGDGAAALGSGVIEAVVNLTGQQINANGFFVVAESTFTLGTADLILPGNGLNFENSDNVTHLLVFNFTGFNGQDLDLNDDGVLDETPWSSVIDSIGLITPNHPPTAPGQEWVYAPTVGPDGNFVPSHVYRCVTDGTWTIGSFELTGLDTPNAVNIPCDFVPICGNPNSPDCFTVGAQPGCSDAGCCEAVCDIDPACCESAWDAGCVDSAFAICLTGGEPPAIQINEIRIDQPGVDNDEYFEIVGPPGTSLDGVSYIVIGDGAAALGSGVIEAVIDLTGQVIPASGFFVVAESTFTLGTADLVVGATGLNFENSDNVTHLLVFNFTGANGQDLDADDDGTLDATPWQSIIDSVGVIGPNYPPTAPGQEWVYSPTIVGPDVNENGTFVPGHIYRCSNGGEWRIGPFDVAIGLDSPGATNPATCDGTPCPADLDGDGVVNGADLGILLGNWGVGGLGDLDGNGVVDGADLGLLLGSWGPCA